VTEAETTVIQQALEAFNSGGVEATREFADPEIQFEGAGIVIPREAMRGLDVVAEGLADYASRFEDLRFAPLEFVSCGEAVVVPTHLTGRGPSGADLQLVLTLAFWLRDGKITRVRTYMSREEALEELQP
jgi:ketosteroid isomerase-like protein